MARLSKLIRASSALSRGDCKMPVMHPQMLVAHHLQAQTREANESEQQDGTVVIREDIHDAPAIKRMLDPSCTLKQFHSPNHKCISS